MKSILSLFFLLIFSNTILSQEIYSDPEFPTDTDSITIFFDATKATGKGEALNSYTGDLYAHTGVITSKSNGNWKNVIGSWGDNVLQPKLLYVGSGLYKLVIGNPREFYIGTGTSTLAFDEKILKMMFVFRAPSAPPQSEDLFIEIFESGIKIKLLEPISLPIFPEVSENLKIKFVTSDADSVRLYVDDSFITESISDTLEAILPTNEIGKRWIKLIATSETFPTKIDSFYYFVRSQVNIAGLPEGIETGINYDNFNTVTLALYATQKDFVYLTGDFNSWEFAPKENPSWEFDNNYYMNLTPDSTIFWKTITSLNVGQEYRFQYLVDGTLQIADPYTDKILEQEDDQIPSNIYPNLIAYPSDKTNFSVSTFQTEQTPFNWEVTNFNRPDKENLVIYEMLVRDFVSTHSYQTIIDTLDYLDSLGITALELMPIMEFEFNSSWGYNTAYYFAPDKYYGTKNDLKQLIDECHKRGIAVIFDIVLNHMYGRSPFVRLYSSGDFGPPTSENPWFNVVSPNPVFSFGYDLNHESEQTQILIDRVNKYWLEEYNIDGYRFDFTKGMTNTPGDGGGFDQARINILTRMANKIWEYDSTAYIILEHFADNNEEKILSNYGMMLWGNLNHNYNEATMGYNESSKSDFSWISYQKRGWNDPHVVGYMESHDEERLMYKNLTYGNSSGDYDVTEIPTALQRIKLAAAFYFTIPGPKMIWQFGELGYDINIDYNGRVGEKPIKWNYLDDINRLNLYKTFMHLINLKNSYEVFSTNDFSLDLSGAVKRIKLSHESMNVVIIGNFDVVTSGISPQFHDSGKWYNYFTGDSINVGDPTTSILLDAGEFHIYTSVKLPTPEEDVITGISDNDISTIINEFQLHQNYPNPFNPTTIISYNIPQNINPLSIGARDVPKNVSLKVFDILGNEITTLVNKQQSPGNYNIRFDASNLSSGIYFYRLQTGNFIETKKLVLLK